MPAQSYATPQTEAPTTTSTPQAQAPATSNASTADLASYYAHWDTISEQIQYDLAVSGRFPEWNDFGQVPPESVIADLCNAADVIAINAGVDRSEEEEQYWAIEVAGTTLYVSTNERDAAISEIRKLKALMEWGQLVEQDAALQEPGPSPAHSQ